MSACSQMNAGVGNIDKPMIITIDLFSRPDLQMSEITRQWIRAPTSAGNRVSEIRGNAGVAPGSWQRQRRIELDCVQYLSVDKSALGIVSAQGQHVSATQGSPCGSSEKSNKAKNRRLVHRHLSSA